MSNKLLWFSLYTNKEYVSNEPAFVDLSSILGIKELELNYEVVKKELDKYLEANRLNSHFNKTMVEKNQIWKVQGLRGWGLENYKKQKHFPNTMALLNAIPNVTSISFNLLEPQSKIKPHCGDTSAIIRCHLGLKVPMPEPICALKVKEEVSGWHQGKVLGFTDAYLHEAWNLSDATRIVLLFDVMKPAYVKQKSKICATVRASLFMQQIGNLIPYIYKMNRKIFKISLFPYVLFLRLKLPVRNAIRYLYNKPIRG